MAKTVIAKRGLAGLNVGRKSGGSVPSTMERYVAGTHQVDFEQVEDNVLVTTDCIDGVDCLVFTVPLATAIGQSGEGKSWLIGTSHGNKRLSLGGLPYSFNLNVHQPKRPGISG